MSPIKVHPSTIHEATGVPPPPERKQMLVLSTPLGTFLIDPSLSNVRKRLMCAKAGCDRLAVGVWCGEGRLSEQQLCQREYDEAGQKALIEEMRKQRREAIKS